MNVSDANVVFICTFLMISDTEQLFTINDILVLKNILLLNLFMFFGKKRPNAYDVIVSGRLEISKHMMKVQSEEKKMRVETQVQIQKM